MDQSPPSPRRPSGTGPPLGAATQSTGRPLVENGVQMPAPLNTSRKLPNTNTVRHEASNSSLSSQIPISAGQVVALVRELMKEALQQNQAKTAEASGGSNELKPGVGVTVDLSRQRIQRIPEEVVDIIKNELERLAVSHNQISTFPSRLSECTSLRYLNVRNNIMREIPLCICQLTSLEILDLSKNKLKTLPPELARLPLLKVLSIQRNRIEVLPFFLGDMASLQVIKLDGNPIQFPPKELLQMPASSSPNGGGGPDGGEQVVQSDLAVATSRIKRFLRQKAISDRSETESGGEESSEGTETPRPMKRVTSGRFPIKVNGAEVPDLRSPALPRPPPIPSRSHYRGLSQQNSAMRRPGVQPLTIGSANERLRSNSESLLLQATPPNRDRSSDRSRRMGIVSKKASELGTVDEMKINRYSHHYRGLSHGSAMQAGNNGANNSRSPASPADSLTQRSTYVRRLSSLPERKRESLTLDPIVEAAKGILYALFQVHPLIQSLLGVTRDGTNKRTSLERVFYNASTHIEELDKHIQKYMTYSEEDEEIAPRSNENIHRACVTCVSAYMHVLSLLARNVDTLIENGDPRYLRTLLSLLYASTAEVRNASASLFVDYKRRPSRNLSMAGSTNGTNGTVRFKPRDKSVTPTRERPGTGPRIRSATVVQHSGNLRVATDAPPVFLGGVGRSATMTNATPRSGESFASASSGRAGGDFTEEDRIFDKIFLRLQQSSEMALKTLPLVNSHFFTAMKINSQSSNPDTPKQLWVVLIQKCQVARDTAESLKGRLSLIKLKEPGIRTQAAFWELCNSFIQAYTDLAMQVKEAKSVTPLLPSDVIVLLRPLQKAIKDTSQLIQTSPWSFLTTPQTSNGMTNGSYTVQSPASQMSLPMTPQSAALGPAVQATVPSTPQSASYNAMFSGNVFERADALLSMNGSSVASSRAGTMTSTVGSHDGNMTPTSMLSPMQMHNFGSRFNSNGKITF